MLQEYYSALASMVLIAARDRPDLREEIYEVARGRLRKHLDRQALELSAAERGRRLHELEAAIEQLEADLARSGPRHTHNGNGGPFLSAISERVEIMPPDRPLPFNCAGKVHLGRERRPRATSVARSMLPFVLAAAFGLIAYAAVERMVHQTDKTNQANSTNQANEGISVDFRNPTAGTDFPLPTAYGIYALVNSRLTQLTPLPIKLPDRSNTTSGLITSASRTKLPNGDIRFVVFDRDLVREIPEKIRVRIIAGITPNTSEIRKLSSKSDETSTWTIRNVSYDMRVAPIEANRAMFVIRPANADFVFPPGRYALVLRGVPYDFAVEGRITDLQQCLERSEVNQTTYTQCRHL